MAFLRSIGSYIWVLALTIFAAIKMFYAKEDSRRFKKSLEDDIKVVNKQLKKVIKAKNKIIEDRDTSNKVDKLDKLDNKIKELERARNSITRRHLGPSASDEEVNEVIRKLKNL